jgi:hypothetical protein
MLKTAKAKAKTNFIPTKPACPVTRWGTGAWFFDNSGSLAFELSLCASNLSKNFLCLASCFLTYSKTISRVVIQSRLIFTDLSLPLRASKLKYSALYGVSKAACGKEIKLILAEKSLCSIGDIWVFVFTPTPKIILSLVMKSLFFIFVSYTLQANFEQVWCGGELSVPLSKYGWFWPYICSNRYISTLILAQNLIFVNKKPHFVGG